MIKINHGQLMIENEDSAELVADFMLHVICLYDKFSLPAEKIIELVNGAIECFEEQPDEFQAEELNDEVKLFGSE